MYGLSCIVFCGCIFPPYCIQVSIPKPNTWTASFPARLDTEMEGTSGSNALSNQGGVGRGSGNNQGGGAAATGGGCSNPTTDGVYVYVWHAGSKRVHKVSKNGVYHHWSSVHPCCTCKMRQGQQVQTASASSRAIRLEFFLPVGGRFAM